MDKFFIEVTIPAMGATVSEFTVIDIKVAPGSGIVKGEKIAELESDKSVFEFEAPCELAVSILVGWHARLAASEATHLGVDGRDLQGQCELAVARTQVFPDQGERQSTHRLAGGQ